MTDNLSWRMKIRALYRVALFKPLSSLGVVLLSVAAAIFEGIGLSFIQPIIRLAQTDGAKPANAEGLFGYFIRSYEILGIPFTLAHLVIGVTVIMVVRFTMSFLVAWLRGAIETSYIRHLQEEGFENSLDARVEYFDNEGSDNILNAIVTQSEYAGRVIRRSIRLFEQITLSVMYAGIALLMAPGLTIVAALFLGGVTLVFRYTLEAGYSIGDRVADANERIQEVVQAGMQGIRDVKLFGMRAELSARFKYAASQFEKSQIKLRRNNAAIQNFYQLATAVSVFALIYGALTFTAMNVGELGVFLFAMFRLGPRASNLNQMVYRIDGELPHLVRTQEFIRQLQMKREPTGGSEQVPTTIDTVAFEDVNFQYESSGKPVLENVSFDVERGEFVAFVGPSGAGKSTIMSVLTRMYDPNEGRVTANGYPIDQFNIDDWRSRLSAVRQDPYIFNESLRWNVTVGNRNASDDEVRRACEIAQVSEFIEELPEGYESALGDEGVRLSGGQRQRIAIARALLQDTDLLILDEATSDLDTSLEFEVHRAIESLDRDYAMLVIAHRLSTIVNADRIYVMEGGRIVEEGTHDELVRADGMYANLYRMQEHQTVQ